MRPINYYCPPRPDEPDVFTELRGGHNTYDQNRTLINVLLSQFNENKKEADSIKPVESAPTYSFNVLMPLVVAPSALFQYADLLADN